ncbi:hypothetical protein LCGC14_2597270, partial [marine sediment metagenome]
LRRVAFSFGWKATDMYLRRMHRLATKVFERWPS